MSHIFQENVQIPIPYGTYVNPTTQQVFIKFRAERSSSKPERVVIGRAVSPTHMFPNTNFKELFPLLFAALAFIVQILTCNIFF